MIYQPALICVSPYPKKKSLSLPGTWTHEIIRSSGRNGRSSSASLGALFFTRALHGRRISTHMASFLSLTRNFDSLEKFLLIVID